MECTGNISIKWRKIMVRGRVWGGNIDVPRKGENSVVDPQFYVFFFFFFFFPDPDPT